MELSLAISPCPNDTFIFDALIHHKIDTEGLDFNIHFADVEALNQSALVQHYDITKLSYFAYAFVADHYVLMRSGSALGNNCGPLLIAKKQLSDEQIKSSLIGIPGKYTTAHFLFSLCYPEAKNKSVLLFSDIEDKILQDEIDAGVIIHENRFTYTQKGLHKIVDLGEYWEKEYKVPIPLGGIAIKRTIDKDVQLAVERCIKRSIEFAFEYRDSSKEFVAQYAQEMNPEVCQFHIDLYVNKYSINLGFDGEYAVQTLFKTAADKKIIEEIANPLFVI